MWRFNLCILLLAIFLAGGLPARAEVTVHLVRLLQLPDGRPAAGVAVLARTFRHEENSDGNNPAPTLLREYHGTSNAQGRVALDLPTTDAYREPVYSLSGYLLLEKPGFAPAISTFSGSGSEDTITLEPAYTLTGTVLSAGKLPVPHATVTVHMVESEMIQGVIVLNHAAKGIFTPTFTTVSDEKGVFSLPGLAAQYNPVRAYVSATARVDGLMLVGATSQITFLAQQVIPPGAFHSGPLLHYPTNWGNPFTPAVITVSPALRVQGRVTDDALRGKALSGAVVSAAGEPAWQFGSVSPVTTDVDGQYTLEGVPASINKLLLGAVHQGYAPGRAKAPGLRAGSADDPAVLPETPITISLRPLATVTGTVMDKVTGQPPAAPFTLDAYYDDGVATVPYLLTADGYAPWLPPTARFTVQLPAGKTRLEAQIAAGSGDGMSDLTIPATGLSDQHISAWRADGIFIQVVPHGVSMANVDVRLLIVSHPGTYEWTGGDHNYWHFPAEKGSKVKVQVLRLTYNPYHEQPLSRWFSFTVGQNVLDWPHVIVLGKGD